MKASAEVFCGQGGDEAFSFPEGSYSGFLLKTCYQIFSNLKALQLLLLFVTLELNDNPK